MSSEDFPALPGTSENVAGVVGSGVTGQHHSSGLSVSSVIGLGSSGGHQGMGMDSNPMGDSSKNSIGSNLCMDMMQSETVTGGHQMGSHISGGVSEKAKRGVQTSPNGLVTNIPATMVNNQFGMIGLLTFIRAAESDPNLGRKKSVINLRQLCNKKIIFCSITSYGSRFNSTWTEFELYGESLSEFWGTFLGFACETTRH